MKKVLTNEKGCVNITKLSQESTAKITSKNTSKKFFEKNLKKVLTNGKVCVILNKLSTRERQRKRFVH